MKNLRINKSLCKKLTAITIATTIGYTQMTQAYTTYAFSVPTVSQEYSANMSYKYSIDGKNYTITRKMDNSLTVVEDSIDGTNTLTMDSKGNVVIKIKDNFLPKTEKFKINNFDGENLMINKQEVKDLDLKKSVSALENYFNNVQFNDSIRGFGSPAATREQYNNLSAQFMKDLQVNNIEIKEPQKIEKPKSIIPSFTQTAYAASPTAVLNPNDLSQIGIAAGTVPAALEGLLVAGGAAASTGILLTTGLLIGAVVLGVVIYNNQVLFVETPAKPINDYSDARFVPLTLEEAKEMGFVDVRSVITELTQNLTDDNPNNDYFKAFMVNDGIIVIDFNRPLSKIEASQVLGSMIRYNEHIYTLSPVLAEDVIKAAGGIPGTSNGRIENIGRAENHAYIQSYKAYDPTTRTVNPELLIPNNNKGIYFWHYHFNGKKTINGQMNNKHTWFGEPTIKTLF